MVTRSLIGTYSLDRAMANLGLAVLTWVSIYWFSLSGPAASVRIYYEVSNAGQTATFPKTTVPVGISFFPKEPVRFPRAYVPISCQVFSINHLTYGRWVCDACSILRAKGQHRFRVGTRRWRPLCGVRKTRLAGWRPEEDVWQVRTCSWCRIWV